MKNVRELETYGAILIGCGRREGAGSLRERGLGERAFELAKNEYLAWLEHKADRYTTVYGYMD